MFFIDLLKSILNEADKDVNMSKKSFLNNEKDLYKSDLFLSLTDKTIFEKLDYDSYPLEYLTYNSLLSVKKNGMPKYAIENVNEFLMDTFFFHEIKNEENEEILKDFTLSYFANMKLIEEYNPALYPLVGGSSINFVEFIKDNLDITQDNIENFYKNNIDNKDNILFLKEVDLEKVTIEPNNINKFLESSIFDVEYLTKKSILEDLEDIEEAKIEEILSPSTKIEKLYKLLNELKEENEDHLIILDDIVKTPEIFLNKNMNQLLYDEFDSHIARIEHMDNLDEETKEKQLFILDNAKAIITNYLEVEPNETSDIVEEFILLDDKEKQKIINDYLDNDFNINSKTLKTDIPNIMNKDNMSKDNKDNNVNKRKFKTNNTETKSKEVLSQDYQNYNTFDDTERQVKVDSNKIDRIDAFDNIETKHKETLSQDYNKRVLYDEKPLSIEEAILFEDFKVNLNIDEIYKQKTINSLFDKSVLFKELFKNDKDILNVLDNQKELLKSLKEYNIQPTNNYQFDLYNYLSLQEMLTLDDKKFKEAKKLLIKENYTTDINTDFNKFNKKLENVLLRDGKLKWLDAVKNNNLSKLSKQEKEIYNAYLQGDSDILLNYLGYKPNFKYLDYFKGNFNRYQNFFVNFMFKPIKFQMDFIVKHQNSFKKILDEIPMKWIKYFDLVTKEDKNIHQIFKQLIKEEKEKEVILNIQNQKIEELKYELNPIITATLKELENKKELEAQKKIMVLDFLKKKEIFNKEKEIENIFSQEIQEEL